MPEHVVVIVTAVGPGAIGHVAALRWVAGIRHKPVPMSKVSVVIRVHHVESHKVSNACQLCCCSWG